MPQVDLADVLLIARRWARRGDHTSVERFVDYLPGAQVLTTDDLWQRPDRVLHWLATRAPHEGYTIWGVEFELRAVLRALRPRRLPRIVHFLYGDHEFPPLVVARLRPAWALRTCGEPFFLSPSREPGTGPLPGKRSPLPSGIHLGLLCEPVEGPIRPSTLVLCFLWNPWNPPPRLFFSVG